MVKAITINCFNNLSDRLILINIIYINYYDYYKWNRD